MTITQKNNFKRPAIGILLLMTLTLLGGCANQDTSDKAYSAQKEAAGPDNAHKVRDMGLTLPVLDALFFEEGFETDLKAKLQLNDDQVQQLKAAARASVADLSEDGTDYLGSARAAMKHSEEQISSILGKEKAGQLLRLVADRYAHGDLDGLFPTQPNAVPGDTRIVINAPAFRMDVFQEGQLQNTYRVGIGYPEFPLPTGMRRIENIIFNPTWTPPDEPWVKGKVKAGEKVAAGSKLNPLGPIKIPIGMPSLIHGGKAVAKLGNFASHGCVGLTNEQVKDFTHVLVQVSGMPISADSIQSFEKNKTKTQSVKLDKPVLVELRYETIVAENGSLHIYRDVYERGTNTLEDATRVLQVYGIKYEKLSNEEKEALNDALNEMNRDAQGNPIVENINTPKATAKDTAAQSKDGVAASKLDGAKKGKVTRSVTGQKDRVVPIAALQGKGYPAPVQLNTGTTDVAGAR